MAFRVVSLALVFSCFALISHGQERFFADYYYVAPPSESAKAASADRTFALSEDVVKQYLAEPMSSVVLDEFSEQGGGVKALASDAPAHQVAFGLDIGMDQESLFGLPVMVQGDVHVFLSSIVSLDAYATRLRVDLSGLQQGEALYVLDAQGRAAFGPYTASQAEGKGFWLPTTLGDTVILALHGTGPVCPQVRVESVSHFFKSIFSSGGGEALSCNIPIGEETNPDAAAVASGIGILIIPYGSGQAFCSGALITTQAPGSLPPEPYLFSAWHCFGDGVDYSGMEVFWDYRSESDDPNGLPRSYGAQLIDYNDTLDAALLKLNGPVTVGPYGRAWVGWDTQRPVQGSRVQTIHHPRAFSMKTSRGSVTQESYQVCFDVSCSASYEEQIEVLWSEGVTEQGSSGSPLLNRDEQYRIIGSLSNGPSHSCTNRENNYDHYSSFSLFFPQVKCYLVPGQTCEEPYEPTNDGGCIISRLFGLQSSTLSNLRQFRDEVLAKSAFGRQLIKDYYDLGPELEQWFEKDWCAKTAFRGALFVGSAVGACVQ